MGEALYLSTGRAAKVLGVSADSVRRLCQARQIEGAVLTPGGQWRIPTDEVARLREEGVPPVPAPLPARNSRLAEASPAGDNDREVSGGRDYLLADPSEETIAAADTVVRLESEVRALELRKQKEQALDWFRQRAADAEGQEAEQEEAEAQAAEEEQQRGQRRYLVDRWLSYGLSHVPDEAAGAIEVKLLIEIKNLVAHIGPDECDDGTIRRMVDGVVTGVLRPWNRRKEIERVIENAVGDLPWGARGISTPTRWEDSAAGAARVAVERLRPDASTHEIEVAAVGAVEVVAAEYAASKAAAADAEMRDRLLMWLPWELRDFSDRDREIATQAVRDAFAALPEGTPREELVAARDAALAPARAALTQYRETLRAEAAVRQKQQSDALQTQLRTPAPTVHRAPTINRRLTG
jgi:excisionase family DNA binding protein